MTTKQTRLKKLLLLTALSLTCGQQVTAMNSKQPTKEELLFVAIKEKDAKKVLSLIKVDKVNVDCKDAEGDAPLHKAVASESLEIVIILLEEGKANVNIRKADGGTPLLDAMLDETMEIARRLRRHEGVDVFLKEKHNDLSPWLLITKYKFSFAD